MTAAVELRAVSLKEQAQALALWQAVFNTPPGFFERYYDASADPLFQEGDTLGAWNTGRLVSAMHLCRRPMIWGSGTLLCGAIANVATLPEARRQGLSRRLLELAIQKMEKERFDFSLLGTGVPDHYAALGWEKTLSPRFTIHPFFDGFSSEVAVHWQPLENCEALTAIDAAAPRPLQFVRPDPYWRRWVLWNLGRLPSLWCLRQENGYLLLSVPGDESPLFVPEWRAMDAAGEQELLQAAASEAVRRQRALNLDAVPQHLPLEFLNTLGTVIVRAEEGGSMLRNVYLPDQEYKDIRQAYRSGIAAWWFGDAF